MTKMKPLDIQVNGYAGVNFNADGLTPEDCRRACEALREDGFEQILATIITDTIPAMCGRLAALVSACETDALCSELIMGLHIEGPFISPEEGFRGAHPLPAVTPAALDPTKRLLEAAGGRCKLFTLAPEQDPKGEVTQMLADQGIVVSAGHTDASLEQLQGGIDHGLTMVTHLGNGCPVRMHRHDNIVQRVLHFADQLWICFIADGVHVESFALKNYLRCAGLDRCIAVTDAMHAARLGPGRYELAGWELEIGEDLVARIPNGNLAGSTITMPRMLQYLRHDVQLDDGQIEQLVDLNPRRALGASLA